MEEVYPFVVSSSLFSGAFQHQRVNKAAPVGAFSLMNGGNNVACQICESRK